MSMIGVKFPPVPGPWIFGMFVAFAGPTRVPAAGRDARALLRMMIQPVPAARAGIVRAPVNALPAWTTISWFRFGFAAAAALIAVWMLPPALTGKVDPVTAGSVVSKVVGGVCAEAGAWTQRSSPTATANSRNAVFISRPLARAGAASARRPARRWSGPRG